MKKVPMRDGYGKALLKLVDSGKPVIVLMPMWQSPLEQYGCEINIPENFWIWGSQNRIW